MRALFELKLIGHCHADVRRLLTEHCKQDGEQVFESLTDLLNALERLGLTDESMEKFKLYLRKTSAYGYKHCYWCHRLLHVDEIAVGTTLAQDQFLFDNFGTCGEFWVNAKAM